MAGDEDKKASTQNAPALGPSNPAKTTQDDFTIDYTQKLVVLPDITDITKLDTRYSLINPYAYAHIKWDDKNDGTRIVKR